MPLFERHSAYTERTGSQLPKMVMVGNANIHPSVCLSRGGILECFSKE